MSGQDSPAPEAAHPDSLLSLIDWQTDRSGTMMTGGEDAAPFQLTPFSTTAAQPGLQNPPLPPPAQQSREWGVGGLSLPDTPVEPAGPRHSVLGYGGGGSFGDGLALSSGEESTAFRFPPVSVSAALCPQQAPTLLPPDYNEVFLETPPDTPTDPHSLFVDSSFPSSQHQQQPYPYRPPPLPSFSSTFAPDSSLPFLDPPPRRQRLQGTSSHLKEEEQDVLLEEDLALLDDLSVFSDTELPAAALEEEEEVVGEASSAQAVGDFGAECLGELPALLEEGSSLDPSLREAWEQSQGSQSLSPLLKQELKLKIMKKRLDNGQEELSLDFSPSPAYQRTEEDEARREVRRAQNRRAARRCRLRKKKEEEELKKKQEENVNKNLSLRQEVARLRAELASLRAELQHHGLHCPLSEAGHYLCPLPPLPLPPQQDDLLLLPLLPGDVLRNVAAAAPAPTTPVTTSG